MFIVIQPCSAFLFHQLFQITDKRKSIQSTSEDSYKDPSARKRILEGCQHNYGADIRDDNYSAMAKKRLKRTKHDIQNENKFLEYLLNFDTNHAFVGSESKKEVDGPLLQQNEDARKEQLSALDVYQKVPSETVCCSDTNNNSSQECSKSSLSPHLNELIDSCLQGTFKGDLNVHPFGSMAKSPLKREELFDSGSPGSLSLLMAIIHNQGLTCSPEDSEKDEPLQELDTANKQLPDTKTSEDPLMTQSLYCELQQLQGTLPSTSPATESLHVDSEKEAENTDGTPDTVASESVLRPFLPENLCTQPSLDNSEETAHLKHDPQIALETKRLLNTGELKSQKKKSKRKKRRLRQGRNVAAGLNTGDFLGSMIKIITI